MAHRPNQSGQAEFYCTPEKLAAAEEFVHHIRRPVSFFPFRTRRHCDRIIVLC